MPFGLNEPENILMQDSIMECSSTATEASRTNAFEVKNNSIARQVKRRRLEIAVSQCVLSPEYIAFTFASRAASSS